MLGLPQSNRNAAGPSWDSRERQALEQLPLRARSRVGVGPRAGGHDAYTRVGTVSRKLGGDGRGLPKDVTGLTRGRVSMALRSPRLVRGTAMMPMSAMLRCAPAEINGQPRKTRGRETAAYPGRTTCRACAERYPWQLLRNELFTCVTQPIINGGAALSRRIQQDAAAKEIFHHAPSRPDLAEIGIKGGLRASPPLCVPLPPCNSCQKS
jgi:hypothetical protein